MPSSDDATGRFSLILVQVVEQQANLWAVTRFWSSDISDIVLLRLTPYSVGATDYRFRHLTLDLLPPDVGERITAFGYHENEVVSPGEKMVTLRQRAATSHGQVVEIHHEFRDKGFLRFPCFRTNARFEGGMSGGPVFNSSRQLCGLVCSGLPPFTTDGEHTSYAVSLWPAMAIPIDLSRVGYPPDARYPLFDLVRDNFLVAANSDRVLVEALDQTGTSRISIRVP
jgi:hypothetical protein